jgi:hypothetical protein
VQARTVLQLEARTRDGCHKFAIFSVSISDWNSRLDRGKGDAQAILLDRLCMQYNKAGLNL